MNTYKLLTHAILTVSCLVATGSAYAQGAIVKTITKNGKKVVELPRLSRGQVQTFVFPRQTSLNIQRAIAAGTFNAGNATGKTVSAIPEFPSVSLNSANPEMNRFILGASPIEKQTLQILKKEEQFYSAEIDAARAIRDRILNIHILTEEGQESLALQIVVDIKNHHLATTLLNELEKLDIYNMALDLTDYFCLDEKFEEAAFNYMIRHPHQMILNMRRLMQNPLVDQEAKDAIKSFLHQNHIAPEKYNDLRTAIATIHQQYVTRVQAAKSSQNVQAFVNYLDDLNNRFLKFIDEHGRAPKHNTANMEEKKLANEMEWTLAHKEALNFSPVSTYWKMLNINFKKAPCKILPFDETVTAFEKFVQTTGRHYPQPIADGVEPSPEETLLWDSLWYWRYQDEVKTTTALHNILKRYTK